MPSPRRLVVPLGGRARHDRPSRRSARASFVLALVAVLGLGGAVAGVYTTGVTLGTRIAPGADERSTGRPDGRSDRPVPDTTDDDGGPGSDTDTSSLPDRASGADGAPGPTSTTGGDPGPSGPTPPGGDGSARTERYPGLWPYASWDDVREHQQRGDARFTTATDTALRFAREVVGVPGATVGAVDEGGTQASVEVRTGRGSSLVTLARVAADDVLDGAPWSVTGARGAVALDAPAVAGGGSLPVTTDATPGVVGVHARGAWRAVGVAPRPGAPLDLRLVPGPAGPAMVVALGGDPREPSTFSVQRVELSGDGLAAPAAPADPVAATHALVEAAQRGDVGAVWELLTPDARSAVRDWRGLAGRLPALRQRLALVATGPLTTTRVSTGVGPVAVVAPTVAEGPGFEPGAVPALAFVGARAARLASVEPGAVTWSGPAGDDLTVLASGPTRPVALVVDGAVWAAAPEGATGLRAGAATLAPGPHLAIAVVDEGGRITASAYLFDRGGPFDAPVDPPATPDPVPAPSRSGADRAGPSEAPRQAHSGPSTTPAAGAVPRPTADD